MKQPKPTRSEKALDAAVNVLMQYFDTVQIFVTKERDEEHVNAQVRGKGNLFARVGQVDLWVTEIKEAMLNYPNESDEGEEQETNDE